MKRYKLLIKYFLLFIIHYSLFTNLFADNIQFVASAKSPVANGEQFYITYSVNANASAFKAPAFKDFSLISGPSQSSSTSMQWVNGQMTQSVQLSYTYVMQAVKEGTFSINPASVTVGGKTYQSNSLTITVVKGSPNTTTQPQQQQQQQQQQSRNNNSQQSAGTGISADDVFVRTTVSKSSAFKGEAIILTQKIYSRVHLAGFDPANIKWPSCNGFWTEEIKMPQSISTRRENLNGNLYEVAELKKTIIIPQMTGKLTIEPAEVMCIVQVAQKNASNNIWDQFFGGGVQNKKYLAKSKAVTIDVKNLPSQNQPADYNGAVGNFTMNAQVDKTSLKTNEAVNLQITISGNGNLKLIDKLNVNFPTDFETYDPKITSNINTNETGLSGSKKFEYLVIPRNPGKFSIKPVTFSYFDIISKTFKTLTSPEFIINVTKGDGTSANVSYRSANQEDVKYIGSDIRFIKNQPFILTKIGKFFFNSTLFYLLIIIPFILFVLFVLVYRRTIKQRSNIALMRNKKATKVAQKRLKDAEKQLKQNNKNSFYIEISKALWGYVSDKFTIPIADLSMDTVNIYLSQKGVSEKIIKKITETLNNCEFARFAPGDSTSVMNNIYTEAINTISLIEKELK